MPGAVLILIFRFAFIMNCHNVVRARREDNKVSHYIINKIQQGDQTRYKIGDQMFTDLPALLNFYKVHYLDTTPLIRPAPKRVEKVLAKYDFEGNVSVKFSHWQKSQVRRFSDCCSVDFGPRLPAMAVAPS